MHFFMMRPIISLMNFYLTKKQIAFTKTDRGLAVGLWQSEEPSEVSLLQVRSGASAGCGAIRAVESEGRKWYDQISE